MPHFKIHIEYNKYYMCAFSCFSHFQLFATPCAVIHQGSLSMGFSQQEYWSGLPCSPLGDPPGPGIELASPAHLLHCSQIIYQ